MILRGTLDPGNTSAKGSGSVTGGTKGTAPEVWTKGTAPEVWEGGEG